jgi:hypothetical protein
MVIFYSRMQLRQIFTLNLLIQNVNPNNGSCSCILMFVCAKFFTSRPLKWSLIHSGLKANSDVRILSFDTFDQCTVHLYNDLNTTETADIGW